MRKAGLLGPRSEDFGLSACANVAICMLFMMRGTLCLIALPYSARRIGTLPYSVLPKTPCSSSCGSVTPWGWRSTAWTVLVCLLPCLMLLMAASASPSSALAAGQM